MGVVGGVVVVGMGPVSAKVFNFLRLDVVVGVVVVVVVVVAVAVEAAAVAATTVLVVVAEVVVVVVALVMLDVVVVVVAMEAVVLVLVVFGFDFFARCSRSSLAAAFRLLGLVEGTAAASNFDDLFARCEPLAGAGSGAGVGSGGAATKVATGGRGTLMAVRGVVVEAGKAGSGGASC
jgi:hypothetical protein